MHCKMQLLVNSLKLCELLLRKSCVLYVDTRQCCKAAVSPHSHSEVREALFGYGLKSILILRYSTFSDDIDDQNDPTSLELTLSTSPSHPRRSDNRPSTFYPPHYTPPTYSQSAMLPLPSLYYSTAMNLMRY